MSAVAERVADAELESGMAAFSRRSQEVGGAEWSASEQFVLATKIGGYG